MTRVTFFYRDKTPCGFSAEGHSGFAEEGSDIVCAAVSAVTQTAAIQAEDVLHMENAVYTDEKRAFLKVTGDGGAPWAAMLKAMELFMSQLAAQYPEHLTLTITEV